MLLLLILLFFFSENLAPCKWEDPLVLAPSPLAMLVELFRSNPAPPQLAIVTIKDDKDYIGGSFNVPFIPLNPKPNIRALLYSYYTAITGWGVLPMNGVRGPSLRCLRQGL